MTQTQKETKRLAVLFNDMGLNHAMSDESTAKAKFIKYHDACMLRAKRVDLLASLRSQ